MMRYLYGDDTFAARQAITDLAAQQQAETRWLDGESITASLDEALAQGGSLFGAVITVLRDPSRLAKKQQEELAARVSDRDDVVLWERTKVDKRSKLWRAAKAHATEYAVLSPTELVAWVQGQATQAGGTIGSDAAHEVVQRLGTDRWRLQNEMARLILLFPDEVTLDGVREHVVAHGEGHIFQALDAITAGSPDRAVVAFDQLWADGHGEFYITAMLTHHFRSLALVRGGIDDGKSPDEIAGEYKLHRFVVQKSRPVAMRLSASILHNCLSRIVATELAIKQGTMESRTAVSLLIVSLAHACAV